ncbi:MAG: phage holin family protein [Micrococcaceae bacterium]|nr:phage holin family protein [Micrococcaceae bacterium]
MSGSESTGTQYQSASRTLKGQVGGLSRLIPKQLIDEARIAAYVLKSKGINVGIAAGAAVVALALLSFMMIALVVALVMGIGTLIEPWLAALLVAAGFLVLALILGLFAFLKVKKAMPFVPEEAIRGFKHDLGVVKEGSAFDVSTLDEPKESEHEEDPKGEKDDTPKADKPTHNELIIRTRERRDEIALYRDGLGRKIDIPMQFGAKVSEAGQAAGDTVTRAAGHARDFADAASEKMSEGVERATDKFASLSGVEGENAKEALRERWQPLAIMAGSVTMFFVFLRKLMRK